MCKKDECCQKPEQLQGNPQDCSPEQIKQCHGADVGHPCVPEDKTDEPMEGKDIT